MKIIGIRMKAYVTMYVPGYVPVHMRILRVNGSIINVVLTFSDWQSIAEAITARYKHDNYY